MLEFSNPMFNSMTVFPAESAWMSDFSGPMFNCSTVFLAESACRWQYFGIRAPRLLYEIVSKHGESPELRESCWRPHGNPHDQIITILTTSVHIANHGRDVKSSHEINFVRCSCHHQKRPGEVVFKTECAYNFQGNKG